MSGLVDLGNLPQGNGGKTLIILVNRPLLQTALFLLSVDAEGGTDWEVHGSRGARWYDAISHAYRYQISLLIRPLPSLCLGLVEPVPVPARQTNRPIEDRGSHVHC